MMAAAFFWHVGSATKRCFEHYWPHVARRYLPGAALVVFLSLVTCCHSSLLTLCCCRRHHTTSAQRWLALLLVLSISICWLLSSSRFACKSFILLPTHLFCGLECVFFLLTGTCLHQLLYHETVLSFILSLVMCVSTVQIRCE